MTVAEALETQRLQNQQLRTQQLTNSLFSSPAISPFFGVGIEPSEQQLALQERNAPAQRPDQEISTVAIDGAINRLNNVLTSLTASDRSLSFDSDRTNDILDFLSTLQTDINDRVKEAEESFEPPSTPAPVTRRISLERVDYVTTNATVQGNVSLSADTLVGDLGEGDDISLTVTSDNNTSTVSALATETVGDFLNRLQSQTGVSASLDYLGRVTIEAEFGAALTVTEVEEGTLTALGIQTPVVEGQGEGEGEAPISLSVLPTRTKETTVEKVSVQRLPDSYQKRLEDRNEAIEKHQTELQKDLDRLWTNASDNIIAEVERSLARGSAALTGVPVRVATASGAAGDRTVPVGNLTVDGLGLTDLGDLLAEGRIDDVNSLIDGAIGRVSRAQSALSFAQSIATREEAVADRSIGRLTDERTAIQDAFTAEFIARRTGLSLQAVQLATASNRSEELRSF
eukprot:g17471.t1